MQTNKYKEPQKLGLLKKESDGPRPVKKQRIAHSMDENDLSSSRAVRQSTVAKTAHSDTARNIKDEFVKATRKPSRHRIKTQHNQKDMLEESLLTEVTHTLPPLVAVLEWFSLELCTDDVVYILGIQQQVVGGTEAGRGRARPGGTTREGRQRGQQQGR